jgi:hypothetical protein
VFVAGAVVAALSLTAFAVATEPEGAEVRAAAPGPTTQVEPSPTEGVEPSPTGPAGVTTPAPTQTEAPEPAGPVIFSSATSDIFPNGCEAQISFEWHADRASDPPFGEVAWIRVRGPGIAGTYREPLRPFGVRLQFTAPLTSDSKWVATVASVGDRPAEHLPLEVTADALPFC